MITLESLPVELVADILSELDLASLIKVSYLSKRLRDIVGDPSLNPWRNAMLCSLQAEHSDPDLLNLSVRNIAPRHNWIEVLSIAKPEWILFEATLPNLSDAEWEECFSRRFLPGWKKWRKDSARWRPVFLTTLSTVAHRRKTRCTADEAWTRYILLNRNGSANQLEASSRNFNPIALFHEIKVQNDLVHLDTRIRVVVQFADVNPNAGIFLHPPETSLPKLRHPIPSASHENYPNYTPGGHDRRLSSADLEDGGRVWVGSLMLVAQLINPSLIRVEEEDTELVVGTSRTYYASFTWVDLFAIAPWMQDKVTKKIDGPGLGLD